MTSANGGPEAIAEQLVAARVAGRILTEFPGPAPASLTDAYAIQDAYIEAMDEPLVGWKVGATNAAAQANFGTEEPFFGPLFAATSSSSPARPDLPAEAARVIEPEFAFRIGEDLPGSGRAYTAADLENAVTSLHPAIEVVDLRIPRDPMPPIGIIVADGGGNGWFVYGDAHEDWSAEALPDHAVSVSANGEVRGDGTGAAALGNPVNVLVWLANRLIEHGHHLRAGDWVSTGVCTPVFPAAPGDQVIADFGSLGPVEVDF